ncbi:MAG: AgmX/PglI C-terminal domain-containing protein [Deltaproteobacteria bacterium]|nr:AgmX/PglI C-terminal domain-containing protein [Deltaproteobacteria bacterium]
MEREEPSSTTSPYRAERPLAEIIPPDRRREKTIALVIASMVAGVSLWTLGGWAIDAWHTSHTPPPIVSPPFVAGRVTPTVLGGPGGPKSVPLAELHVVHVWLQGCQDCMPAFEAMREMASRGGLGLHVPELNVAYGEADPSWATRYGVGSNLLFDSSGGVFVKPLGIGSFTTLVIDAHGNVIHRDRPDRPGYRERLRIALGESGAEPKDGPAVVPPSVGPGLDPSTVVGVVTAHQSGLRRVCWERHANGMTSAEVNLRVRVAVNGSVESVTFTGDPVVGACVASQVKSWRFPAPHEGAPSTVEIPFRFRRE